MACSAYHLRRVQFWATLYAVVPLGQKECPLPSSIKGYCVALMISIISPRQSHHMRTGFSSETISIAGPPRSPALLRQPGCLRWWWARSAAFRVHLTLRLAFRVRCARTYWAGLPPSRLRAFSSRSWCFLWRAPAGTRRLVMLGQSTSAGSLGPNRWQK